MSSLSIKRIRSKTTEKRWRHRFPHYKSMGAFCCHGNQSFEPVCSKTLCSLSPTPVMLHIKFDQDWPTGFRDIQVWTSTDDGSLVYYKLNLWAFLSGELTVVSQKGPELSLEGNLEEKVSLKWLTSPCFELRVKFKYIEHIVESKITLAPNLSLIVAKLLSV